MIRLFAWSLAAIVVAIALSLSLGFPQDPGYLLIAFGNRAFETSLFALLVAVCVLFAAARLLWMLVTGLNPWQLVSAGRRLRARRRANAKRATIQGLLSLVRGEWTSAARFLEKGINEADASSVNFLGLAHIADRSGDADAALGWLDRGEEAYPDAAPSINTLRAEILLRADRLERCVEVLQALRSSSPADTNLLRLLREVYERQRDWSSLDALMPALVKHRALPSDALSLLADRILLGNMRLAKTSEALQGLAKKAQAAQREDPKIVTEYSKLLLATGDAESARRVLEKALKKRWERETLLCYGQLDFGLADKQLLTAEQWQRSRPGDAALQLTLARLAMRCEQWIKAREYYEASFSLEANAAGFAEYAALMRALGEVEKAAAAEAEALALSVSRLDLPTPRPQS